MNQQIKGEKHKKELKMSKQNS